MTAPRLTMANGQTAVALLWVYVLVKPTIIIQGANNDDIFPGLMPNTQPAPGWGPTSGGMPTWR